MRTRFHAVIAALIAVPSHVRRVIGHAIAGARSRRAARGDARAHAICPVDDWVFTPLYTDGSCPLCGWTPPGYVHRPPVLHRFDWYYGAILGIAAVSAVMLITVLAAFTGS